MNGRMEVTVPTPVPFDDVPAVLIRPKFEGQAYVDPVRGGYVLEVCPLPGQPFLPSRVELHGEVAGEATVVPVDLCAFLRPAEPAGVHQLIEAAIDEISRQRGLLAGRL